MTHHLRTAGAPLVRLPDRDPALLEVDGGLSFWRLTSASLAETGEVMAREFSGSEPVSRALGITREQYLVAWGSSFYQGLPGGPSVIAREGLDGPVGGIRLAADLHSHWPRGLAARVDHALLHALDAASSLVLPLAERLYPNALGLGTMAWLDHVAAERWLAEDLPPGLDPRRRRREVLYMLGVAVAPPHRGLGLGLRMTRHTQRLARRLGYRHAVVKCSGEHPRRLFRELGYTLRQDLAYDTVRFAGRSPLRGLEAQGGSAPGTAGFCDRAF